MIEYRAAVRTGRPLTAVLTLLTLVATLLGGSLAWSPPAMAVTDHSVNWRYFRTDSASVRAHNYQLMITRLRATASAYRGSMYRTSQGNTEIVVGLADDEHFSLYFNAGTMYLIGFRSHAHGAQTYAFAGDVEQVGQFTHASVPQALPTGGDYTALERMAGVGRSELGYSSESMLSALSDLRNYDGGEAGVTNVRMARAALQVAAITAEAARFHHISEFMHTQAGSTDTAIRLPAEYLTEENNWAHLSNYAARVSQVPNHQPEVVGQRSYSSFQDAALVLAIALSRAIDHTCKRSVPSPTWSPWESLGGALADSPKVVSQAPNSLDAFVQGMDGHLYTKSYNGVSWSNYDDLGAPPGGTIVGAPAVVSLQNGRLDVFVRGSDNALWHKRYVNDAWSDWESLGGALADSPTVVSRGPNSLNVFVRGSDNALWHKWYVNGNWSDWEFLEGEFSGAPAVVPLKNGGMEVLVRGSDNHLWNKWYVNGNWSNWESLGGELSGAPVAVPLENGGLDVSVRGSDNALWHKRYVNDAWSDWESLGGALADSPTVVSQAPNRLDVVIHGNDTHLQVKSWTDNKSWTDWESLDGTLRGTPAAVSSENGREDVFVRGSDNALWHKSYVADRGTACAGRDEL
ncbi:ribosome-inactivating family protein [Streptomyces avidinii]|uniref:ribosome-inactivating family protein n=1 Tax=Streptomyces TaxID=1883 RepID=UPI002E293256|nr:ribosome-inactivating family protein [Streptomyces sp. NBC_00273]WST50109.1 ribosome-inactivating family protein [Streptomyces avidinii]WTB02298.1 ribosome-inactivating family protein [Streptomyces avidinii]